jgi:D-inositol-3-phosphate glycosyltransferase
VDLDVFRPMDRREARARHDIPADALLLLFVGRIQPLKAPDLLLMAAADLLRERPELRSRLLVAVLGGPSGSGLRAPESLQRLAVQLGLEANVRFAPPVSRAELAGWYAAADLVAVPSYNESFGLVAVEAQACGTPVVAAGVGGLRTAVADGVSGVLVDDHEVGHWAKVVGDLLQDPAGRERLARGALTHAARFSWEATVDALLGVYRGAQDEYEQVHDHAV